jgi:hypothetical protein
MAISGTITGLFDNYRNYDISITGAVLGSSNTTPIFRSHGFVIGSWTLQGSLTTPSVTLQGSNDGVNFFAIGTAVTATGIFTMANPTNLVPTFYNFNLGASGSGTASIFVTLMSTFG